MTPQVQGCSRLGRVQPGLRSEAGRPEQSLGLEPAEVVLALPDVDHPPAAVYRAGDVGDQAGGPVRTEVLLNQVVLRRADGGHVLHYSEHWGVPLSGIH